MRKVKKKRTKKKALHKVSVRIAIMRRFRFLFRRLYHVSLVLGFGLLCFAIYWLSTSSFISDTFDQIAESFLESSLDYGLSLENVYLEGQSHSKTEDILSSLDLETGQPILSISLSTLRSRLEELPWIKQTIIARQLPNTLHIRILERQAFALWQHNGELSIIDNEGVIIDDSDISSFSQLMLLVGEDAPDYANSLLRMLSSDEQLFHRVASAVRVGERRWSIHLNNGIEIKLPEINPERSWDYLVNLHHKEKILDKNINSVDLRIPDRLYINPDRTAYGG